MSEIRKLEDILTYTLDRPPPLPSIHFRERLRDVILAYADKKKYRGWTTFYKREFSTVFESTQITAHPILHLDNFVRRMNYWCGKEEGDLNDRTLIFAIVYFLIEVDRELVSVVFSEEEYIRIGRVFAEYFSERELDQSLLWLGPPLPGHEPLKIEPGVYRINSEFLKLAHRVHYVVITDVGEPDFLKVNSFEWYSTPQRFDERAVGYCLTRTSIPKLLLKAYGEPGQIRHFHYFDRRFIDIEESPLDYNLYAFSLGPALATGLLERIQEHISPKDSPCTHLERQLVLPPDVAEVIDSIMWDF